MNRGGRGQRVGTLSWDRVRDALAAGAPAVLPIGSGAKQHGFHLPMSTDAMQAEWFASRLADMCVGLVWPTLAYGHYPSFVEYAGSISVRSETFQSLLTDVIESLICHAATHVFVLNTGISTIAPIDAAIAQCSAPQRTSALHLYRGDAFCRARARVMRQQAGSHADEIETSIMLAIDREAVNLEHARPSQTGRGSNAGKLSPDDQSSANYSESGSIGDPRLANIESGRRLIAAILEDMQATVDAVATQLT